MHKRLTLWLVWATLWWLEVVGQVLVISGEANVGWEMKVFAEMRLEDG